MPALITKFSPPRWRAVVTVKGKRKEKLFPDGTEKSKRAAEKWEERQRRKLKKPIPIDTDSPLTLINLGNPYLDFVKERQSKKTYAEKHAVIKRFTSRFGQSTYLEDIISQRR